MRISRQLAAGGLAAGSAASVAAPAPGRGSSQDSSSGAEEDDCCWICLQGGSGEALEQPCRCPRLSHRTCLSRWQLQSVGRTEEAACRFCSAQLPSWQAAYEPLPRAEPIFTIVCNGQTVSMPIQPGEEGRRAFEARIRQLFGLGDEEICLTFGCRVPGSQHELTLQGSACYDAAVYLASLSAGQRKLSQEQQAAATAGQLALAGRVAPAAAQLGREQAPPRQRGSPTSVLSAVRSLFS